MEQELVISATGLTKVFRDFWNRPKAAAVNDIDFDVRRGEVFGLLGPNGSGKSTTVKMLLGLLYPTSGILRVLGQPPKSVKTKRAIGYLPEETYLYKYLTAYETLDFFGSLFGLSAAERKSRALQLLDMVGLAHAANRKVGEFSKGMARRIGLAQAMINDPDLLILDEPTSGLDPIGCREVKDLIKTLKARGKTIVITSHLLSDVESICDRVVILYGGRIRAEGALSDLLAISEKDTITLPHLQEQDLNVVMEACQKFVPADRIDLEHPRMTLEDFFLDVVAKAKQEASGTAGAQSGNGVAAYLSGEPEKANLLEQLSAAVPEPVKAKETEPAEPPAATNTAVLDQLKENTPEPVKSEPPAPQEDLSAANSKLSALLNDKRDV